MSKIRNELIDYGADVTSIMERFVDDEEFYVKCLTMFFADTNMEKLAEAVKNSAYDDALSSAHTLKGIVGNLGLTPLYREFDMLVAVLRAGDYSNLDTQYAAVVIAFKDVKTRFAK